LDSYYLKDKPTTVTLDRDQIKARLKKFESHTKAIRRLVRETYHIIEKTYHIIVECGDLSLYSSLLLFYHENEK
jgi:hypothetical protein